MAVAYANSNGQGFDSAGGSFAFDCGAGADLLIAVYHNDSAKAPLDSMTYNGVGMTQVLDYNTGWGRFIVYSLVAPASGSNTLACTITAGDTPDHALYAVSFSGADQTTPVPTTANANSFSTSPSVDITTQHDNSIVVDFVAQDAGGRASFTPGAGQTERLDFIGGDGAGDYDCAASTESTTTAGSVTMSHTSTDSDNWQIIALEIKEDTGGGGSQSVSMNAIAATTTIYNPTVTTGAVSVSMNAINAAATLYQMTVTFPAQAVSMNSIAATATLYEMSVGVGAVAISMNAIASSTTLHNMTVTTGAVSVSMQSIDATATLFNPSVTTGAVAASMQSISSTATLYNMSVLLAAQSVSMQAIPATTSLHNMSVTTGSVSVSMAAIAAATILYNLTIGTELPPLPVSLVLQEAGDIAVELNEQLISTEVKMASDISITLEQKDIALGVTEKSDYSIDLVV